MKILPVSNCIPTGQWRTWIIPLLISLPVEAGRNDPAGSSGVSTPLLVQSVPQLSSLSFMSLLEKVCGGANYNSHAADLEIPKRVDLVRGEIIYRAAACKGHDKDIRLSFADFHATYKSTFSEHVFIGPLLTRSLSELLGRVERAVVICTTEYLMRERNDLRHLMAGCLTIIGDFSNYQELQNYRIPMAIFHRLLKSLYPNLHLHPLGTFSPDGRPEYLVRCSAEHREVNFRSHFTVSDAFCFYACNIKQVDRTVLDRFVTSESINDYTSLLINNRPISPLPVFPLPVIRPVISRPFDRLRPPRALRGARAAEPARPAGEARQLGPMMIRGLPIYKFGEIVIVRPREGGSTDQNNSNTSSEAAGSH